MIQNGVVFVPDKRVNKTVVSVSKKTETSKRPFLVMFFFRTFVLKAILYTVAEYKIGQSKVDKLKSFVLINTFVVFSFFMF